MNNNSTNDASGSNPLASESIVPQSRNAFDLVASLTPAFSEKSPFTISTRFVDRQNSPELKKIKEKVKALPRIEFQTLSEIGSHLQDSRSKLQEWRRKLFSGRAFFESEPEFKQVNELGKISRWVTEETNHFGTRGEQSITRHANEIDEGILFTRAEEEKIQLKIRAIHILRDKTEYRQGFWDAVQDKLLPDASIAAGTPAEPIVALALWVAGLIVSGVIFDRSWKREKFLKVLNTWEHMLSEDQKIILETRNEMIKYLNFMSRAAGQWSSEVGVIWITSANSNQVNTIIRYEGYMKDLEVAERMVSLTIKPFEQFLGLMYPFYGPGLSVQRNTKNFCDDVPDASIYLTKLLTAKAIIQNSQQEQFQDKVYCFARIIYGRLEQIEKLCAQWSKSIDPGELAVFLEEAAEDFLLDTGRVIQEIKHILKTGVHDRKRDKALKKRMALDRHLKSCDRKDRPLVTSAGAMEVLEDLEGIIRVIHRVSISTGTGTNMPSMEGVIVAQRSYVEFNHSNSLLEGFFKVLREEIQRGSIAFPESRETGTTETKTSRSSWWRIGQRKKPEAPISGL